MIEPLVKVCHNGHINSETGESLRDAGFKRAVGVQRPTFEKMLAVEETGIRSFGRRSALSHTDQLLRTLVYWREYRTEFHIGLPFGVSESTVCRTIERVETALLRSGQSRLPGKRAL